ncbi:MAG: SIS domain-containing protein [Clostridia bacterium]|nr:SIS domain-containing protein [Clostridia bacterium]
MVELFERYPALDGAKQSIEAAKDALIAAYKNGGKLLLCGNGGSCADCDHIVGELMKGFLSKRPLSAEQKQAMKKNAEYISDEWLDQLQGGVPAISLPSATALNAAFCNDVNPELMYAQQLMGLGNAKDVLLCISTSGNSKNVYAAAVVGKALGLTVIGLTGEGGGKLKTVADICICVPETETYKIQELHLPVYHYLCAAVEAAFFGCDE